MFCMMMHIYTRLYKYNFCSVLFCSIQFTLVYIISKVIKWLIVTNGLKTNNFLNSFYTMRRL